LKAFPLDIAVTMNGIPLEWSLQNSLFVPAGPQSIRWGWSGVTASPPWLDGVVWKPLTSVPLAEALDSPDLIWKTGGDAPWTGFSESPGNGAAARAGLLPPGGVSWLEFSATGPGELTWNAFPDVLQFKLNGVLQDWNAKYPLLVPEGPQTMRWEWNGSFSDPPWLDQVHWVPYTSVPLDEALDTPGAGWQASAGHWQSLRRPDGTDFVRLAPWPGQGYENYWGGFPWEAWIRVPPSLRTGFVRFSLRTYRPAAFANAEIWEIVCLGDMPITVTPEWRRVGIESHAGAGGDLTFNFQGFADPVPALLELDGFHTFTGNPEDHFVWWIYDQGVSSFWETDDIASADSDGDGVSNLLEYAFGGEVAYDEGPAAPVPGMPQVSLAVTPEGKFLRLTYWQRKTAVGLVYQPEFSVDVAGAAWTAGQTPVIEVIDAAWNRVTVLDTVPVSPQSTRRFGRVRVIYTEPR
jgi:hypothetical protein